MCKNQSERSLPVAPAGWGGRQGSCMPSGRLNGSFWHHSPGMADTNCQHAYEKCFRYLVDIQVRVRFGELTFSEGKDGACGYNEAI